MPDSEPEAQPASGGRSMAAPSIEAEKRDGGVRLHLSGDWLARSIGSIETTAAETGRTDLGSSIVVDCGDIGRIDTSGAYLIETMSRALVAKGATVEIEGLGGSNETLFGAVRKSLDTERTGSAGSSRRRFRPLAPVEGLGRTMAGLGAEFVAGLNILGASLYGAGRRLTGKQRTRPAAIVNQMDRMGVRALPIIALMSFLIGGIVAQQGAFQLRYFGAEIFVIDLVGILTLRELGVILTAIMVAGRSGSAITAEIGSMRMREEVDALQVIGLNPIGVLVFPRLVALVIVLPLLTVVANLSALLGAGIVVWVYSGITPDAFMQRLREVVDIASLSAGLIKAPFMALIIGIVASVEGMRVGGSAESLGRHVTSSVVKAIFLVILVDGIFAIFYAAIGF